MAYTLLPLSVLYRTLLAVRRLAWHLGGWQAQRLPVPVVVVGNVVAGGAGKTPTVLTLVRHLQARGWRPGVVSRGHGRQPKHALLIAEGAADPERFGDEPALIARDTGAPLAVGRNRPAAARALLQRHPDIDVIVSDDGMQHWALARDLTIIVFDDRDVGNGWLLPAGPLREPWPGPIWGSSAALVLRTAPPAHPPRAHPHAEFSATRALAADAINVQGDRHPLHDWVAQSTPVGAFAGIARPQAFFAMLRQQGLNLVHTLALPDHAPADQICAALRKAAAAPGAPQIWLCTDKDAIKLHDRLDPSRPGQIMLWRVPLVLTPEPGWFMALDRHLERLRPRPAAL